MHATGEARGSTRASKGPVRVVVESTGNCHWVLDRIHELGNEVSIGGARIRAVQVRKQKTDRPCAARTLDLLLNNDVPRIWTPRCEWRLGIDVLDLYRFGNVYSHIFYLCSLTNAGGNSCREDLTDART